MTTKTTTREQELQRHLLSAFGDAARIVPVRPESLFRLELPAFMEDGDSAQLYLEPLSDGRVRVSDLGYTSMRLSYTDRSLDADLEPFIRRHGFSVADGSIAAEVPASQVLAAALGLLQIETQAEREHDIAASQRADTQAFEALARKLLSDVFGDRAHFKHALPEDRKELYPVDAFVDGQRPVVCSFITGNQAAERAVSTQLYLSQRLTIKPLWLAVPRNATRLSDVAMKHLMDAYILPFESINDVEQAADTLRRMAS